MRVQTHPLRHLCLIIGIDPGLLRQALPFDPRNLQCETRVANTYTWHSLRVRLSAPRRSTWCRNKASWLSAPTWTATAVSCTPPRGAIRDARAGLSWCQHERRQAQSPRLPIHVSQVPVEFEPASQCELPGYVPLPPPWPLLTAVVISLHVAAQVRYGWLDRAVL